MSDAPSKKKKKKKRRSKRKGVRHGDWVRKKDPQSGRYYYGNVKTLERVWDMPDEFRAAAEAAGVDPEAEPAPEEEDEDDASRDAADGSSARPAVSSAAASSAAASADDAAAADEWLEGYDPKNKRKYYVNKVTGESRWTKPLSAAEVNAEDWISGRDPKTKRIYYFNKTTKETTWEKPPGYVDPSERSGTSSSSSRSGSSVKADADTLAAAAKRRKEVQIAAEKEKKAKEAEEADGSAQAKRGSTIRKHVERIDENAPDQAWVSGTDPKTNRVYYYNKVTEETTWTKPKGYVPEGSGPGANNRKLRTLSQEKIELDAMPLQGIVESRKSGFAGSDGGGGEGGEGEPGTKAKRRRPGHRANLSLGTQEAHNIIMGLGSGQKVSERRNSLEKGMRSSSSREETASSPAHGRTASLLEDFKTIPQEIAATLPRPQNGVATAFSKLVEGETQDLHDSLHLHRARLGGVAIASLKDLVHIFGDGQHQAVEVGEAEFLASMKMGRP